MEPSTAEKCRSRGYLEVIAKRIETADSFLVCQASSDKKFEENLKLKTQTQYLNPIKEQLKEWKADPNLCGNCRKELERL